MREQKAVVVVAAAVIGGLVHHLKGRNRQTKTAITTTCHVKTWHNGGRARCSGTSGTMAHPLAPLNHARTYVFIYLFIIYLFWEDL